MAELYVGSKCLPPPPPPLPREYFLVMANEDVLPSLLDGVAFDHNGAAFLIELLEWGHTFSEFWGRLQKINVDRVYK